jgi:hypothetical protein
MPVAPSEVNGQISVAGSYQCAAGLGVTLSATAIPTNGGTVYQNPMLSIIALGDPPPGQQGGTFSGKILPVTNKIPNGTYKVVVQLAMVNQGSPTYFSTKIYDVTIANGQGVDNPPGTVSLTTTPGTGSFTGSGSATMNMGWTSTGSKVWVYLPNGGIVKSYTPTYTGNDYTVTCDSLTAGSYQALTTLSLQNGGNSTQVCSGFKSATAN